MRRAKARGLSCLGTFRDGGAVSSGSRPAKRRITRYHPANEATTYRKLTRAPRPRTILPRSGFSRSRPAGRIVLGNVLAAAAGRFPHLAIAGLEMIDPPLQVGLLLLQIFDEPLSPRHRSSPWSTIAWFARHRHRRMDGPREGGWVRPLRSSGERRRYARSARTGERRYSFSHPPNALAHGRFRMMGQAMARKRWMEACPSPASLCITPPNNARRQCGFTPRWRRSARLAQSTTLSQTVHFPDSPESAPVEPTPEPVKVTTC